MINNFKLIKDSLLKFESDDDFYLLQIIQRRKDNSIMSEHSHNIKFYYVYSKEYLDKIESEIITLCNTFNARAYIAINKQSFYKVAFQTLQELSDNILQNNWKNIKNIYASCCGKYINTDNRKWLIDIDNIELKEDVIKFINNAEPKIDRTIIEIPTKNGVHLITSPFDRRNFYSCIDIHKNNPTLLYISTN